MRKIEKLSLKQIQTEMPMIPGSHLDGITGGTELIYYKGMEELHVCDGDQVVASFSAMHTALVESEYNLMDTVSPYGVYSTDNIPSHIDPLQIGPEGIFRVDVADSEPGMVDGEWFGIYERYQFSDSLETISESHGILITDPSGMEMISDAIQNYGALTTLTISD